MRSTSLPIEAGIRVGDSYADDVIFMVSISSMSIWKSAMTVPANDPENASGSDFAFAANVATGIADCAVEMTGTFAMEMSEQVDVHIFIGGTAGDPKSHEVVRCAGSDLGFSLKGMHMGGPRGRFIPLDVDCDEVNIVGSHPLEGRALATAKAELAIAVAHLKHSASTKGVQLNLGCPTDCDVAALDPRALSVHGAGLSALGIGWLAKWDEVVGINTLRDDKGDTLRLRIHTMGGTRTTIAVPGPYGR
jgi:hypothetical protein